MCVSHLIIKDYLLTYTSRLHLVVEGIYPAAPAMLITYTFHGCHTVFCFISDFKANVFCACDKIIFRFIWWLALSLPYMFCIMFRFKAICTCDILLELIIRWLIDCFVLSAVHTNVICTLLMMLDCFVLKILSV